MCELKERLGIAKRMGEANGDGDTAALEGGKLHDHTRKVFVVKEIM